MGHAFFIITRVTFHIIPQYGMSLGKLPHKHGRYTGIADRSFQKEIPWGFLFFMQLCRPNTELVTVISLFNVLSI